jgi:uncharacterized membrane protein
MSASPANLDAERGTIGLWLLGLCLMLLLLGGLSLDLWRAFSERRALAGMVDAAALAGASGIDVAALHTGGPALLHPVEAERLAAASLAGQQAAPALRSARVAASPQSITVRASAQVDLTLLRLLAGDRPLEVRVTATSGPRVAAPDAP